MGRLRVFSGKQVCNILARHGFLEIHQRGSHIVMQKRLSGTTITVPVPNYDELRAGTLQRSSAGQVCPGMSSSHEKHPPRMSAAKKRVHRMVVVRRAISRSKTAS